MSFLPVVLALSTALCVTKSQASMVWRTLLSEWQSVACWDEGWSVAASLHVTSTTDSTLHLEVQCLVTGPIGNPLNFYLQADADELGCEGQFQLDSLQVVGSGGVSPEFYYAFTPVFTPGTPYQCGPTFPILLHVPPGDGCVGELGYVWDHANFPDGQVALVDDFAVPADETLFIEAGMEIFALPGTRLTIVGSLEASGTAEEWITIHGEGWRGLRFSAGAQARFSYCRITGADSPGDGGALRVEDGAVVYLDHCLVDHNTSGGAGGAAWVGDGGALILYRCTVSHNRGTRGGIHLGGGSAYLQTNLSLLTFAIPVGMELTGAGVCNVQYTDIFPQRAGFPSGMTPPSWYCNPGYVDAAAGDFHLSYWSVSNPHEVCCTIDASSDPFDNDPDGTPGDMGAFSFDQHTVLSPVRELAVADRPGDQGGFVLLSFRASPNDGGAINPVTLYSLWERQPGMAPGQWLAVGTVAALGDSATVYHAQVATLDDQWPGHENLHVFRVGAHSVDFGQPAFSTEAAGASLDNIAPPAPTGLQLAQTGLSADEAFFLLELDACPANDFDRYEVRASPWEDFNTAQVVSQGAGTAVAWGQPLSALQGSDSLFVWVRAIDAHANASPDVHTGTHMVLALAPPTGLTVTDRPDDQGRVVLVRFLASANDGDPLFPVASYTIWAHQPGMAPGEWLDMATLSPQGDPDFYYQAEVATTEDRWPGHPNAHFFRVSALFPDFDLLVYTAIVVGVSFDNLAPEAVSGLDASGPWYYEEPHQVDQLDLQWEPSGAADFDHYVLRYAINSSSYGSSTPVDGYDGQATSATFTSPYGVLHNGDVVTFWVRAVDVHANNGPLATTQREFQDSDVDARPLNWGLGQNHPNPFNPTTRIELTLPVAGPVRLSVFDMRGVLVATLLDGPLPAGRHELLFDGGGLASGVYLYQLEAPGFRDLKKMVLVK
jgi:hypothetical protein